MSAQSQSATNGGVRPGAGRPVGSRGPRQRMVAAYVAALGGADRVSPIQLQDVERCVDMVMLAKTARAELAAGKTSIDDVVKLENAADRAQRRLNLPAPNVAARVMDLHDHAAMRALERASSLPVEEAD